MLHIGITGQIGFIGTHLYNFLGLMKDEVERILFEGRFFDDNSILEEFVRQCEVIILVQLTYLFHYLHIEKIYTSKKRVHLTIQICAAFKNQNE
jgi:hypothetical protein